MVARYTLGYQLSKSKFWATQNAARPFLPVCNAALALCRRYTYFFLPLALFLPTRVSAGRFSCCSDRTRRADCASARLSRSCSFWLSSVAMRPSLSSRTSRLSWAMRRACLASSLARTASASRSSSFRIVARCSSARSSYAASSSRILSVSAWVCSMQSRRMAALSSPCWSWATHSAYWSWASHSAAVSVTRGVSGCSTAARSVCTCSVAMSAKRGVCACSPWSVFLCLHKVW